MKLSPKTMKWLLRFYPPFFFQRIWVVKIYKDYTGLELKIYKSIFNINTNKSIFGGTIFSAIDPVYPLLFNSILIHRGYRRTISWLKSAQIQYIKPGTSTLYLQVRIREDEIDEIQQTIQKEGKVVKTFSSNITDKHGDICAVSHNEIYIRDLSYIQKTTT